MGIAQVGSGQGETGIDRVSPQEGVEMNRNEWGQYMATMMLVFGLAFVASILLLFMRACEGRYKHRGGIDLVPPPYLCAKGVAGR